MINNVKRILAILALASMAVFLVAVVMMMVTGTQGQYPGWIYGPMTVFLALGLTSLLINWLQKKAEEQKQKQEQNQ